MSRSARIVLPDVPLHVVHRGNRRAPVFVDDADRIAYLEALSVASARYQLEIWAYCLMSNHVHLVVVPRLPEALAKVIGVAHQRHAARLNRRHEHTGHLWENRYFSTLLDERHLWTAVRYVERNPVRAGLVERAEMYAWSSAASHCSGRSNPFLAASRPFPGPIDDWSAWLAVEAEDPVPLAAIRHNSRTGFPTGSPDFTARVGNA